MRDGWEPCGWEEVGRGEYIYTMLHLGRGEGMECWAGGLSGRRLRHAWWWDLRGVGGEEEEKEVDGGDGEVLYIVLATRYSSMSFLNV